MDKYEKYTVRDFVQDDDFIDWVKYPSAAQNTFWAEVIIKYPDQKLNIDKAAGLIRLLSANVPEVSDAEVENSREIIFRQISRNKPFNFSVIARYLSIAAVVAVAVGLGWSYFRMNAGVIDSQQIVDVNSEFSKDLINNGDKPMLVTLPDSSTVTLSPGSQIYYSYDSPEKRDVRLEGEAYFSVTPNTEKPFFVLSGGLVTRVLGTTFTISAFKDVPEVKVAVNTGRVEVYPAGNAGSQGNSRLTLNPNQQAVFKKDNLSLTRLLVEEPRAVISQEALQAYTYTDAPLSEIFHGLEQVYGIRVIYDEEKFKDCRVNMSLTTETLFEKLELIGKIVDARYNVADGKVIIIGEGCR